MLICVSLITTVSYTGYKILQHAFLTFTTLLGERQEFNMSGEPSELIKYLSQFGSDGINVAVNSTLSDEEQNNLKQLLSKVSDILVKTPVKTSKRKVADALPTSLEIFNSKIIPQIEKKLDEHEKSEYSGVVSVQV